MPRMTPEEFDADLAAARLEGFREARKLTSALAGLGLSMPALAGALDGQAQALDQALVDLRAAAEASRAKPDADTDPPARRTRAAATPDPPADPGPESAAAAEDALPV